jgi:hypothetical protein
MSNEPLFSSNNIIFNVKPSKVVNKTLTKNDLLDYHDKNNKSWSTLPLSEGLYSTQQLNVDWSDFSNHTFFHSAEVKVNAAYERIVNHFPYDGSQEEKQYFYDNLNGFEAYVFSLFPRYLGYLNFDKSTSITTKDSQGYLYPSLARKKSLQSVLGAGVQSDGYTLEFFFLPPDDSTTQGRQTLFQKLSDDKTTGISVFVSSSLSSDSSVEIHSIFSSGSGLSAATRDTYVLHVSSSIPKGEFSHIGIVYDKSNTNGMFICRNGLLQDTESSTLDFDKIDFIRNDITIGSGSSHVRQIVSDAVDANGYIFESDSLLTGSIDELRFWTYAKSVSDISSSIDLNVQENDGLALYYKFNEPTGSYANASLILDASGNGLHASISGYSDSSRIKDTATPVKYESDHDNPVLFPDYPTLTSKNIKLLNSASNYDVINPNYIIKLVPKHYLENDSIQPLDPTILPEYTSSIAIPGGGKMPSNQIIAHFLYLWAAFYDDVKLYIDSFTNVNALNHRDLNGIPQHAIEMVARQYGYELPNIFSSASPEQFNLGRRLNENTAYSTDSLKDVLASIWRRVTSELPHISRSKGTISSIRMMLNSFGIDADSNFRIREYGSHPGSQNTARARKERAKNILAVKFDKESMYMYSENLVANRWEPGIPAINFNLPVFNPSLGTWTTPTKKLNLTSGSWTFESHYELPEHSAASYSTQSLARLEMSSSDGSVSPFVNCLVYSGTHFTPEDYKIRLVVASSGSASAADVDLMIPNVNMFDGSRWYLNISRENFGSRSKINFRVLSANGSRVYASYATSSFLENVSNHPFDGYQETTMPGTKPITDRSTDDKPFISIGKTDNHSAKHLNNTANAALGYNTTDFAGDIFSMRFWSKALTDSESTDHALNPFSFGSANPVVNSNFVHSEYKGLGVTSSYEGTSYFKPRDYNAVSKMIHVNSGSWQRLRMVIDNVDSYVTGTDANGSIEIRDTSRNGYNFHIRGAATSSDVIKFKSINYSTFDSNWDSSSVSNKIRVRSFLDKELAEASGVAYGALTSLDPAEKVPDDKRFSIEASIAQALNEDITNAISDIFFIGNAVGAPELQYSSRYPELDNLADKYFNRLEDKVDFKNYFEFFKWFDTNFSSMIESMVPSTTEFLGVNFVIESHMLERNKIQYQQADVHIDLSRRLAAKIQSITQTNVQNFN